ncbi:similar to Saccharomyces cerevisiae YIL027C KRE27 Member of a transmembrane complex required for efficient folding of proteins in the ER [Maudiozyma barnettii]|uniref:Similar to Saccharomyces cerevisiae YIL027C KRE27 Member of a transmembrane complex required for efficient folding of proteins in the ER n=1 Tax=Maudiozyma barnettii TaxID=61262 RepID=A0A8H2VHX7_9SACH|nr:Emc5p [Kazachstania barnettii]CAB4255741.1 similar to Saccharomyces cerevisiae YIL027C KRE27 Member of a transmembrane complex required for efficient folding of proteins in the ER [Kazachstania barnettii]CAD1784302.1 similar to Saccharomyces cerevisiae YIL027C KRE27 Member of a transmembrane complex required for efficient folding of proteins in the ER [Kazachstania barnettii]
MSLISKILQFIAIIIILHSGFSSYEFNQTSKHLSQNDILNSIVLPIDIKYEAIAGLLLFIISVFVSFEKIEYYSLRRQEGHSIETLSQGQYLKYITLNKATDRDNMINSDPTGDVSYTPNMVHIHEKRKLMRDWIQKQQDVN